MNFDRGSDDRPLWVRVAFESLDAKDRLVLTLFCIDQLRHVEMPRFWVYPRGPFGHVSITPRNAWSEKSHFCKKVNPNE